MKKKLQEDAAKEKIILNTKQIDNFEIFMEMLLAKNKEMNLTAITDEQEVYTKHFLDSLIYAKLAGAEGAEKIADVGTGAGFPGLPIKLWLPDKEVTLMDSLKKRLNFIDEVITKLRLTKIDLVHTRAEDAGQSKEYREKFDLVLSRAVAYLPVLAEYCMPLTKVGGIFAATKGADYEAELEKAEKAIKILGGKVEDIKKYYLPDVEGERTVVIIRKLKETPLKYPRKAGLPTKKPL